MEVPLYSLAERNGHRLPAAAPAIVRKAGVSGGPAVEITHLRKAYGNVVAVDDVSLSVPPAEPLLVLAGYAVVVSLLARRFFRWE